MDTSLVAHLESDLDTHLMTLKFLGLFGDRCRTTFHQSDSGWASLVVFDATLFPWDRQNYPGARQVALADGNDPAEITRHLGNLGRTTVVKSSDPGVQETVERVFRWNPVRRFLWYTGETTLPLPDDVREVTAPDPGFTQLLVGNGWTAHEWESQRVRGARGYVAEEGGEPRAFCLAYPNHPPVWELASVRTLPGYLRRGWGARVVSAGLASILSRGHRVRYHVDAENGPSRALAESLGLVPHVEARHYLPGGLE
jgi:ribosomal protein S18 acetylase RimI-like enzyme